VFSTGFYVENFPGKPGKNSEKQDAELCDKIKYGLFITYLI